MSWRRRRVRYYDCGCAYVHRMFSLASSKDTIVTPCERHRDWFNEARRSPRD